jgi:uncharacterized damage-inducible protein DinB
MNVNDVLSDAFDRLPDLVRAAVEDLSRDQLRRAPADGANPVGWLVWHLARVQDHHVADLIGTEQIYVRDDWAGRFGLCADPSDIGYAHTPEQVAGVRPESPQALVDYYTAVSDRTRGFLAGLKPGDLDTVVDETWDPPVTLGVRLISVLNDDTQHVGQAAYVRGLIT